ncbi:unnamed protein product [Candidula unifasciata]|uniref:Centromere protein S n=1 Tax=Candidula unifasciata TaxID=100452 RepID=A0A8S3Z8P2_9EUPU|nr:unnamed protein product [Candidula unifasciata]
MCIVCDDYQLLYSDLSQVCDSKDADSKMDVDYDTLDKDQRLKASMYLTIKQIAREVEEEMEIPVSAQVLATLSETLARQVEVYASDLEDFAKHARRTNVNTDDVKLLARRNTTLLQHWNSIIDGEKSAQQEHKKEAEGGSKEDTSS